MRRGVQVDRWQIEFQQAHVLHDQRVDAGVPAVLHQAARRRQFGIGKNRVERDVDTGVETVGVLDEVRDIAHGVAGVVSRTEGRSADVNGVRAMQDGLAADLGGAGGGEQFDAACVHKSRRWRDGESWWRGSNYASKWRCRAKWP